MTLEQFNKKYKYQTDKERFNTSLDIWELPKDADIIRADCESYCRYLKNNISGFKDWDYYYCKLNGEGHCILLDYENMKMIDNNTRDMIHMGDYLKRYKITDLRKYNWFIVVSKIMFAKVYTWIF